MNKILKRLLTGVLTLATVFTALPTTAVHAAETQYWTESSERVGIVEKVMNDGSIGSTFNEGHMTVEGEDAYCVDINTIRPTRCMIEENQRYLKIEREDQTTFVAYFTINNIVSELDFPSSEIFYYQQQQFTFPVYANCMMNMEMSTW